VQTKDVADTMLILVHALIGDQVKAFINGELAELEMHMSQPGGGAAAVGQDALVDGRTMLANFARDRRAGQAGAPERGRLAARSRGFGSPAQRRAQLFGRRAGW
jgi:hypothetical protein